MASRPTPSPLTPLRSIPPLSDLGQHVIAIIGICERSRCRKVKSVGIFIFCEGASVSCQETMFISFVMIAEQKSNVRLEKKPRYKIAHMCVTAQD